MYTKKERCKMKKYLRFCTIFRLQIKCTIFDIDHVNKFIAMVRCSFVETQDVLWIISNHAGEHDLVCNVILYPIIHSMMYRYTCN